MFIMQEFCGCNGSVKLILAVETVDDRFYSGASSEEYCVLTRLHLGRSNVGDMPHRVAPYLINYCPSFRALPAEVTLVLL